MDWYLAISAIVVALLIIVINIYVLAMFVHPDDVGFGSHWLPKAVVVSNFFEENVNHVGYLSKIICSKAL